MDDQWTPEQVLYIVVIIAAVGASGLALTFGLLRAGSRPTQSMLVVSLSLLSAGALIGGLLLDSDSALALAGAGIGALAGAVSSTFGTGGNCPPEEDRSDDAIHGP